MRNRLPAVLIVICAAAAVVLLGLRLSGTQTTRAGWQPTDIQPLTDLVVVFHPDTSGRHDRRFTLRCAPAGGTLPGAASACRLLAATHPFTPPSSTQACSMIYGGPQTAFVHGVYRNRPVRVTLMRTNGCQIARFRWLDRLLGDPAAVSQPPAGR